MAIKGQASRKIKYVHIAKDGVTITVTPTNIVAHNGLLAGVFVKVRVFDDGSEHNADSLGPLTTAAEAGKLNTETGVVWSFFNKDGVFGYSLVGTLKKDVTYSSHVVYKNVEYPFTLQLTRTDDGKPGDDGQNAVDYRLVVSPNQLSYDLNTSQYSASKITVAVNKIDGSAVTQVSDLSAEGLTLRSRFLREDNSTLESVCNGTVTLNSTSYKSFDFILKKGDVEIDRVTVAVAKSGENGTNGKNGVYVPLLMLYEKYPDGTNGTKDYQFQSGNVENGDNHLDFVGVLETTGKVTVYQCVVNNKKSEGFNPATDNNNKKASGYHWKVADSGTHELLATDVLWAHMGRIEFFNAQNIRLGTSEDNMFAYFGTPVGTTHGGAIIFCGGNNVSDSNFIVYADGSFSATNAEIEGKISASVLDLKISNVTSGGIPNGSLCFDTDTIKLPALTAGVVRSIKVYNPKRTRATPSNLMLVPENTTVKISTDGSFDMLTNGTKSFNGYGRNGNVYLELLGINLEGTTIWTVNLLSSNDN